MQYEKLEFPEAVAELAERAGLGVPREAQGAREAGGGDLYALLAQAARFFEQNLSDDQRARAYLAAAASTRPTAAKFALGYAPDSWNALLNRFGPRTSRSAAACCRQV